MNGVSVRSVLVIDPLSLFIYSHKLYLDWEHNSLSTCFISKIYEANYFLFRQCGQCIALVGWLTRRYKLLQSKRKRIRVYLYWKILYFPLVFAFWFFRDQKCLNHQQNVKCQIAVSKGNTRPPVDLRTLRGNKPRTVTRLSPDRFSEAQTERIEEVKCSVLSIQ
jgi:hypothetical protein